jgi:membrane carboxypeptidase/penicillin-binding protein
MNSANTEQRQLAVLGLNSVSTSPLQLARAYRQLLQRMPPNGVIANGLRDSVDFGMANPASIPDMSILGKTGTASDPGESWTHGWFVGILPGRLLIVIYVPHGDGGAAATLGQKFFQTVSANGRPQ